MSRSVGACWVTTGVRVFRVIRVETGLVKAFKLLEWSLLDREWVFKDLGLVNICLAWSIVLGNICS